jgi:hypothetical protein
VCTAFLEALCPVGQGASARLSASVRRTRTLMAGLDPGARAVDLGHRWWRSAAARGHRHTATRPAGVPPARAAPPQHRSGPGRSAPRGPHRQSARSGATESPILALSPGVLTAREDAWESIVLMGDRTPDAHVVFAHRWSGHERNLRRVSCPVRHQRLRDTLEDPCVP